MYLLILFALLMLFRPVRGAVGRNCRFCIPFMIGAGIGWDLGGFLYTLSPVLVWTPFVLAPLLGLKFGRVAKRWLDDTLGG